MNLRSANHGKWNAIISIYSQVPTRPWRVTFAWCVTWLRGWGRSDTLTTFAAGNSGTIAPPTRMASKSCSTKLVRTNFEYSRNLVRARLPGLMDWKLFGERKTGSIGTNRGLCKSCPCVQWPPLGFKIILMLLHFCNSGKPPSPHWNLCHIPSRHHLRDLRHFQN